MKLSKRARDGIWLVEWIDKGRRRRVSTGERSRVAAMERAASIIRGDADTETSADLGVTVETVVGWVWESRWQHDKSSNSHHYRAEILKRRWGDVPVAAITWASVQEWIDQQRGAGLKPSTINNHVSALSTVLTEAANRGELADVPKLPRCTVRNTKDRFVSPEEEQLLLRQALKLNWCTPRPQGGGRTYKGVGTVMAALIEALLYTGCRLGEVIKALPEDVSGGALTLHDTKNGRTRSVPLLRRAEDALRTLWDSPTWGHVTEGVHGNKRRLASARQWCSKRFALVRNRAGLPDVSLHTLRHTCASRLVQAGVDLYHVQQILGHSSPAVTQRYAHLKSDNLREAINHLEIGERTP